MNIQRWERLQQSPVTKEHRNRKAGRLFAHAYSCSHKNSLNKAGVRGSGPSPELLALRPHRASSGPAAAPRAPPCAQPLPAAPTSGRCSRSPATRAPLRPGPAQALGPGGPGAARSRGPESPCLAVSLRGSCGQLCGTPGALSRVPGVGRGGAPGGRGAAGDRGVAGDLALSRAQSPRKRRESLCCSCRLQAPSAQRPNSGPWCGFHGYGERNSGAVKLFQVFAFHPLCDLMTP